MPYAGGGNWVETRALEAQLAALAGQLAGAQADIAGLKQGLWQQSPSSSDPTGTGSGIFRARATSDIATGTVDNPGTGTATILLTGASVTVNSIYDKVIINGAGMWVGIENFKWGILSVDKCDNLRNPAAGNEPDFFSHQLDTLTASDGILPAAGRVGWPGDDGGDFDPTDPHDGAPYRVRYATAHGNGGTAAVSFPASATGNSLFAVIVTNSATVSAGPAGWSHVVSHPTDHVEIWWSPAASSASSASFTLSGSNHYTITVAEVSGLGATPSAGTAADATSAGGSSLSAGPVTLGTAGYVVAGFKSDDGNAALFSTPTGGFTLVDQAADGASTAGAYLDLTPGAGSYTAGLSYGAASNLYAVIAPFHA